MRPIDADALMENYDIKSATKYGNQTAEQLHNSYSTMMLYEIADMIEDAPTIDVEPVVRCKDCKHFDMRSMECQNDRVSTDHEGGASYSLNFYLEDYCSFGERKMDEEVQHAEKRSDP